MTDKLYRVKTVVPEYDGRKDVVFHWWSMDKQTPPRPYAELIENYDPTDKLADYMESCIDEMFTKEEADQLVAYLKPEYGDPGITTVEEVKLPVPPTLGISAGPRGVGYDDLELYRAPEYSLPFKVCGYFDLRNNDLTDKQKGIGASANRALWDKYHEAMREKRAYEAARANKLTDDEIPF